MIFADRLKTMDESATLALNARVKQMASEGKTVFNLTAGELDESTPRYIEDYVSSKLTQNKYTAVQGLLELRQGIAKMCSQFYGLGWISPESVLVTAGAKPALFASLMAFINPGDEVIVPIPAWVSYNKLIELAGGNVVEVPLNKNYDLNPAEIKKHITKRTKAILLNSPHNPTGAVFSKEKLENLAGILKDSSITVISDDIYSKLVFSEDFIPVPKIGFDNLVIINGFSKSQALTGWRIGYTIADKELIKAMAAIISHSMGNASLPSQHAAISALKNDDRPPQETMARLKKRRDIVKKALDSIKDVGYRLPEGAFYFFLDLRKITTNSAGWCERLLEKTGVALVPGEAFSAPGFARLTFVTEDKTLIEALKRIKAFVSEG